MRDVIGTFAALAACLYAGAAIYVSAVAQPARLAGGDGVRDWIADHPRAKRLQSSLLMAGVVAGLARWWRGREGAWLLGALVLLGVMAFTVVLLFPLNARLLAAGRDPGPDAGGALRRWGRLHAVRSAASVLASLCYLHALAAS